MPVSDYIQGEKFIELQNNDGVYYRHTHDVNDFFKNPPTKPFVLISHNSDGAITDSPNEYDADVGLMPANLVRWYGQNVDVEDDRIESIPIGLENSKWFKRIKKIRKLRHITNTEKQNKNIVYLNFNIKTYPSERQLVYDLLSENDHVTVEHGKNGVGYDNYLDNIYNHKFVLCPRGNGIDTHRTWEALYANTIPILKKHVGYSAWRDLPICWVDDWSQVSDVLYLIDEWDRIAYKEWNLDKLNFNYWKNVILCTSEPD